MKKYFVLFVLSLFLVVYADAKKPKITGSVSVINVEGTAVDVHLDYTSAEMDDMSFEKALSKMELTKEQWNQTIVPTLISNFCKGANNECKALFRQATATPAQYALTIQALTVDDDGETEAKLILKDTATGEILGEAVMNADGGRFGSWQNLMGDALERMGEEFGELVDE